MIIKSYLLFFHFILGTFISGGFFIAMSFFFQVSWAGYIQKLNFTWKRLSLFVPVLYIPLILFGRELIPLSAEQNNKTFYFSFWFILLRAILSSLGIWLASQWLERRSTLSLIIFFVTGTLIAIDWGMALENHWDSNIYGLIYLSNFALVFFALLLFFYAPTVSQKECRDLVHVLITLLIMWGYMQYSQFIILWMSNKPSEVSFYLVRQYPLRLMIIILLVKFVPLMTLAFLPTLKVKVSVVRSVCVLVVIGGWLELIWLLGPPLHMGILQSLFGSGILLALAGVGLLGFHRRWV